MRGQRLATPAPASQDDAAPTPPRGGEAGCAPTAQIIQRDTETRPATRHRSGSATGATALDMGPDSHPQLNRDAPEGAWVAQRIMNIDARGRVNRVAHTPPQPVAHALGRNPVPLLAYTHLGGV